MELKAFNPRSPLKQPHSLEHQQPRSADRLFSLDLLKAISITAVVSYHAIFLPRSVYADSLPQMEMLFAPLRFCVPVLFTISFLLFERGLANRPQDPVWPLVGKRLLRLAIPTVFWFSVAAGLKLFSGNDSAELMGAIANGTIFQGAYYLLAMFLLVPLYVWFRRSLVHSKPLLATIVLQAVVFLLIYSLLLGIPREPNWLPELRSFGRPLFVYWFVYVALGAYFWKHWDALVQLSRRLNHGTKTLLISLSCLLLILEYSWLFWLSNGQVPPFDYAMVSCIASVVVAFLCAAGIEPKHFSKFAQALVGLLSKYSLGIFCINGILSEVLLSFGSHFMGGISLGLAEILAIKLVGWIGLLAISLGLSILLDRIGLGSVVR